VIDTNLEARQVRNYIDGGWSAASGDAFESRDPATGDLVATARASTVGDLDGAIAAARRAFDETGWPTTAGKERAAILL
jgi:betaine-aldehyde dehydrogenase